MASTRHRPNHAPRLHCYRGLRPRQRVFQPSGLRTNAHPDPSNAAGDPVSRTGASRGHGQYPAPPQSRTSIGTQSCLIGPGPVPRFFSRSFLKEVGRGRFLYKPVFNRQSRNSLKVNSVLSQQQCTQKCDRQCGPPNECKASLIRLLHRAAKR